MAACNRASVVGACDVCKKWELPYMVGPYFFGLINQWPFYGGYSYHVNKEKPYGNNGPVTFGAHFAFIFNVFTAEF